MFPSPAKVNLFLAVTGRRSDGFHELVSVAAPLDWGDCLEAGPAPGGFELGCDRPDVPTGAGNLVIRAARAYEQATGWSGARFELRKRIPMAAGLGGGSSNAAAALLACESLSGRSLGRTRVAGLAAQLGSDCALFLAGGPVVMRGRGERVERIGPAAARIEGRRIAVFKPSFGVPTPWAYGRLAATAGAYLGAEQAERRLAGWSADPGAPAEALLFNSFEAPVFDKFPALAVLAGRLEKRFGLHVLLSGSGSACFALLPEERGPDPEEVREQVLACLGAGAFFVSTRIAKTQIPV